MLIRGSILIVVLALGTSARADDVGAAREHYKAGTTAYNLGQYLDAAKEYELAYRARNDPALLFNIAQAYRLGEDYRSALRAYKTYLHVVPDAPTKQEVEERIVEMQKLVEQQERMKEKPPQGTIVPEKSAEASPNPPPAIPAITASPISSAALEHRARVERAAGIGLSAGGGALIVLGAAFVGLAKSANDDATAGGMYHAAAEDRRDAFQAADAACFVIGAVALVGGVALYLVARHERARAAISTDKRAAALTVRF